MRLASIKAEGPKAAVELVNLILDESRRASASDVHLQPTPDGLEMRWRIDGVLLPAGLLPPSISANVVSRLKVLAELLTYRTDVPQEGRIRGVTGDGEVRVSTFPTLYGEKAVVRLFASSGRFLRLDDLGLPERRPRGAGRVAPRDLRRDPADRAGRERQDDHDLRLPPRAGRRQPGTPEPGDAGRPDRGGRRRASRNRR